MRTMLKLATAPLISLGIIMLGQGFFNTFVSVRLAMAGYSTQVNGLVNACYFAGMVAGSLYIENFIRRIGHIRAFSIFASINAAVILLQSFYINVPAWMAFRFLVGTCAVGLFVVIESWLLLLSTTKTRGKLLSLYMLMIYLAQGIGQFILNLTPLDSMAPYATSVFLSSLSVIPVCVMRSGAPQFSEETSYATILHIIKTCPFGIFGCFISGLILSAFYSLGPVFSQQIHLSVLQISQVMGFTILGGLVLQWPIGHMSDIFDRLKVLIFVALILIGITSVLFFAPHLHYTVLIAFFILFGGFSFTLYPLSITYTTDYFASHHIISIASALYVIYGIGSILGPLLAPIPMTYIRPSALFLYDIALLAILTLLGLSQLRKKRPKFEEEQGEYIPLPRTTPLAYFLDPRLEESDDDTLESDIFED